MKYTSYNNNFYACDFETLTTKSKFYQETKETKVWLAYAKRFHPNGLDQQEDEILTVTIEEFFEEFWKRKESATLFFHNLKWDGEFIKWYLVRNGYEYYTEIPKRKQRKGFTIIEDDKNIYFINVFKPVRKGKSIVLIQLYIRCSLNLLTISIEKLGKIYGVAEKQKVDYFVDGWSKLEDVPQIYIDYIKTDVEIMIPPLQQFNKVFKIRKGNRELEGLCKLTISSTALNVFKSKTYKKYPFKKCFHLPYDLVKELKWYYSGGLTSFTPKYQYNETKVEGYVYDVNSMYPSVMMENEFPLGYPEKHKKDASYKIKLVKIFIIKAKIKNENWVPLMRAWQSLLVTYPKHTRYIKATAGATAYYFEEELESIKRFYDIEYKIMDQWYFKSAPYFKEFIKEHYDLRKKYKKENDPREHTIKILLNSAYGKFGQKPDRPTLIYSPNKYEKGDVIEAASKEFVVETVREENSCLDYLYSYICNQLNPPETSMNVVIAACVTMKARVKLHNAIYENIDNFIYCDTDSIFLNGKAKGVEIDETKLGAWKCEGEFDSIEVGGAKLYSLYLKGVKVKSANAGIDNRWAKENLKKGDIITIDKLLGVGSKKNRIKCKGGLVLEETNFTIKHRG